MANGDTNLDYPEDLGQDYRAPVATPGTVAVSPPARGYPFLSPDEAAQRETMRRLQYQVADLPLAQAEQAVTTALKFQAIRGYQKDLANGVSASDALVKWGPIMFSQPKAGNLAGAASLARAGRRMQVKPMNVGGVAYRFEGNRAIPMTPVPPTVVKPTQQETDRRKLLQSDYDDAVRSRDAAYKTALKVAVTDEERQAQNMAYQQINEANSRIEQIRNQLLGGVPQSVPGTPAAPVTPAPTPVKGARIKVRAPDGRTGTIPESQLDEAKKAGYTVVK